MALAALVVRTALPMLLASTFGAAEGRGQDDLGAPSLGLSTNDTDEGAWVTSVYRDGPAARAGIVRGDLIIEVNGMTIHSRGDFVSFLASLPLDKSTKLKVSRDGRVKTLTAKAERAVPLYSRLCEADDYKACGTIGYMLSTGNRVGRDAKRGESFLTKACDGGYLDACVNLGTVFETGQLGTPDPSRSAKPYETACDGGLIEGCINLARLYQMGSGVSQDRARALQLYTRACDAGDAQCCFVAGRAYYFGFGIPVDLVQARLLFLKACKLGNPAACGAADSIR